MDAHLEVDKACAAFFDELFPPDQVEVHRYQKFIKRRTLRIGVSEREFADRVRDCLEAGKRAAIACATQTNAQCWRELFAAYDPVLLTSQTQDCSCFEEMDAFLADKRLVIYTSKLCVGVDIQAPWDQLFLDYRGHGGASGRVCVQMLGRWRQLQNSCIHVLSERRRGTPVEGLDQTIADYAALRKDLSQEHNTVISGSYRWTENGMVFAPKCLGRVMLENLRASLEDKMVVLTNVVKAEGWSITYDDDEPEAEPVLKKIRDSVLEQREKRKREMFAEVTAMDSKERDLMARVDPKVRPIVSVLSHYKEALTYEEFCEARKRERAIERHQGLVRQRAIDEKHQGDNAETTKKRKLNEQRAMVEDEYNRTKPFFDLFGKFEALQDRRLEQALRLAGVGLRDFGAMLDMALLEANATEILKLVHESAAAGRRRLRGNTDRDLVQQAVVALRCELQQTLGMTLTSCRKRLAGARSRVYRYEPLASLVKLHEKRIPVPV
jgi:hypothetical protein